MHNPEADQLKREKIPTIADLKTLYRPTGSGVMIIPLPTVESFGSIVIPQASRDIMRAQMNEGHVVAVGPNVEYVEIGDCVTWAQQSEYRFELEDGSEFINIVEGAIVLRIPKEALEQSAAKRTQDPLPTELV